MKINILFAYFVIRFIVVSSTEQGIDLLDMEGSYRVVGGHPAIRKNWPYIVVIAMGPMPLCGGSLITADWALTAGHCVDPNFYYTFTNYPLGVGIGIIDMGDIFKRRPQGEVIDKNIAVPTIKDFIIADTKIFHPGYKLIKIDSIQFTVSDLAMIKLSKSVDLSQGHSIARLVSQPANPGTECASAGWGIENLRQEEVRTVSNRSNILYALELKIKENQECFEAVTTDIAKTNKQDPSQFSEELHKSLDDKICAVPLSPTDDLSMSDEGGPLRCGDADYGVLSGKAIKSQLNSTRNETYIFFTDTSKNLDWITATVRKHESSKPGSIEKTTRYGEIEMPQDTREPSDTTETDSDAEDKVRAKAYKFEQRSYIIVLFLCITVLT